MLEIEDIIVAKGIHAAVEADDTSVLQILTQEARARIAGNGRTAADVLASLRGSLRGAIVSEILKATTVQRLHDLIDSTLSCIAENGAVERSSVCGRFMRWVRLQLSRAPFSVLSALLEDVQRFAVRYSGREEDSPSTRAQQSIDAQVAALFDSPEWQPYVGSNRPAMAAQEPVKAKYGLQQAQERLSQAVDRGAVNTAEEALHHLFDLHLFRPASAQAQPVATGESITGDPPLMPTSAGATHSRKFRRCAHLRHHFVLLSKAEMHLWFGDTKAAIQCLFEAVQMAQANGDARAVAFILNMLSHLRKQTEDSVQADTSVLPHADHEGNQHLGLMARSSAEFMLEAHQRASQLRLWRLQSVTANGLEASSTIQVQDWMSFDPQTSHCAVQRCYGLVDGDEAWAGIGAASEERAAASSPSNGSHRNINPYSQQMNAQGSEVLASLGVEERFQLMDAKHEARAVMLEQEGQHVLSCWERKRQEARRRRHGSTKGAAEAPTTVLPDGNAIDALQRIGEATGDHVVALAAAKKAFSLSRSSEGLQQRLESFRLQCHLLAVQHRFEDILSKVSNVLFNSLLQPTTRTDQLRLMHCRYLLAACDHEPTIAVEMLRPFFNSLAEALRCPNPTLVLQNAVLLLLLEALTLVKKGDDACQIVVLQRDILSQSVEGSLTAAKCFLVKYEASKLKEDADSALSWLHTARTNVTTATPVKQQCAVLYYQALMLNSLGRHEERDRAASELLELERSTTEQYADPKAMASFGLVSHSV